MKNGEILSADKLFNTDVIDDVKKYLVEHNESIAVAESVTSGLLQTAFGSTPDATNFYQGGITAYNVGQKYRHLLIEPIHALSCNCISQKVANEMALNVCTLFKSNVGVAVTGYASAVEESGNKLFAYYTIVYNKRILVAEKVEPRAKEPFCVQLEYVNVVLEKIKDVLV